MKARDFFKTVIKDNSYSGYDINYITDLDDDFYCDTYWQPNKSAIRKSGISRFINEIYKEIASKTLSDLNINQVVFDEEFEANKDQQIFSITGRDFDDLKVYTGNIVGSVLYKDCIFNINCRFGNNFLQYMIANASGFLEFENMGAIDKNIGLGEWILIYYWKLQLKKAFAIGLYKTYQKKRENLSVLRGNIDINTLLKKDYLDGKTICNFKEHSYDNELNSVISLALSKVFKPKYQSVVRDIYGIKTVFDSINTSKVNFNQIKKYKVINPYFKKYNQVFDLSLKILKDEFANVGENKSDFSAFLFDVSLLFEHHIRKVLKGKFQLTRKNEKGFLVPNGIGYNSVFPDIIINYIDNRKIGVYDVKYKNFDSTGVNREDRFQLISYVATHLSKFEVIECGIIYPIRQENYYVINSQILEVCDKKIPFKIRFYPIANNIKDQPRYDINFIESFV